MRFLNDQPQFGYKKDSTNTLNLKTICKFFPLITNYLFRKTKKGNGNVVKSTNVDEGWWEGVWLSAYESIHLTSGCYNLFYPSLICLTLSLASLLHIVWIRINAFHQRRLACLQFELLPITRSPIQICGTLHAQCRIRGIRTFMKPTRNQFSLKQQTNGINNIVLSTKATFNLPTHNAVSPG